MTDLPRYDIDMDIAAEADLRSIALDLRSQGADAAARAVVGGILGRIASLDTLPLRGSIPSELQGAEVRGFRQFVSGPYRVIYLVRDGRVTVVLVADGRRDMRALLTERLLGL